VIRVTTVSKHRVSERYIFPTNSDTWTDSVTDALTLPEVNREQRIEKRKRNRDKEARKGQTPNRTTPTGTGIIIISHHQSSCR
jgi:hypothetical protein